MSNKQEMLIIGLTGPSGAGKSTVSRMFSDRGVKILDADLIARDTIEGSSECLTDLVLAFSTEIITPDATLNRPRLAEICFSNPAKLKRLNEITYPHIIRNIAGKIEEMRAQGEQMLVLDAPTLFESGLQKRCRCVVAVLSDEATRVRRIVERDQIDEADAKLRVNAQNKDEFYSERADYIIKNDDDVSTLRVSFLGIFGELERLQRGEEPRPAGASATNEEAFEELTDRE